MALSLMSGTVQAVSVMRSHNAAMEQGFISDVISTDLHTGNINGPVYDLPTVLSKMMHLGLSLEEVVEKTTISAAKAIQREEQLGHLKVGTPRGCRSL